MRHRHALLSCVAAAAILGVAGALGACGGGFDVSGDDGGENPDGSVDGGSPDGADATMHDGPEGGEGFDAHLPDVFDEVPPSCEGGFACVPAQPVGWQTSDGWNLYEVHRGAFPDGGAPPCDPKFALLADYATDPSDAAAQCACGCDPPADPCPLPPAQQHVDQACGDAPCATTPLQNGTCAYLTDTCNAMASAVAVPDPTPAGCTPDASTTLPDPFAATTRACVSQYSPGTSDCPPTPSASRCPPGPSPRASASA